MIMGEGGRVRIGSERWQSMLKRNDPAEGPYAHPPYLFVENCLGEIDAEGPHGLSAKALREDIKWLVKQRRMQDPPHEICDFAGTPGRP